VKEICGIIPVILCKITKKKTLSGWKGVLQFGVHPPGTIVLSVMHQFYECAVSAAFYSMRPLVSHVCAPVRQSACDSTRSETIFYEI
jgi:hypothetical protein